MVLDSSENLYVLNSNGGSTNGDSITIYPSGSSGDTVPTATITSSFTELDVPLGIAVDSTGSIYAANQLDGASRHGSVTIYPAGSYASVPPIATIAGNHTKLNTPYGIALDSNDNVAVLNSDDAVTMYPANSNGNVRPLATIKIDRGGYNVPTGIAVGPSGKLYVVNQLKECPGRFCYETSAGDVAVYPAESDGNANPSAVIRGPKTKLAFPSAIAVDHSGDIYVANDGPKRCVLPCGCFPTGPGSVTVYAPGSKGDVKPITTIRGENTGLGLPLGIALDSNGNIYVSQLPGTLNILCISGASTERTAATNHATGSVATASFDFNFGAITGPILVFAAGSDGDVAPIATIGGSFTGLDLFASGIAVGPAGP